MLRTRGIVGLVQQLESWLEKAALIDLINPEQGWEPVRRDLINDVVIADVKHLFELPKKDGGATALGCRYVRADNTIYTFVLPHPIRIDGKLKKMISEEASIAIVAWSGRAASGGPFIADKYEPENVTNVASLILRARNSSRRVSDRTTRLVGGATPRPQIRDAVAADSHPYCAPPV